MSVGDEPLTFNEIKELVEAGEIAKLYRSHECLTAYRKFKEDFKARGIDVTTNLLVNQLFWSPKDTPLTTPSEILLSKVTPKDPRPFANTEDIIITTNTFPYNITPDLTHLCIWIRSSMPPDPESPVGDVSEYNKFLIKSYIVETFVNWLGIPLENIIWFKNWASLQSVKQIPHIHIIIKDLTSDKLQKVLDTGGVALNYNNLDSKL